MGAFSQDEVLQERWFRGRLDYKLHAGQKIIRAKYRAIQTQLFVGECARQFGKSYLEVVEAIEIAIRKPQAKIKIATAFHTDLVEFIIPAFHQVLADCPYRLLPVYKSQKSKFIFPNGSEIKLIGLDRKPNGLRGTVIDLIILDEAGFISGLNYIYQSVIIPATTHRPDCKVLVFSTPPATPAHEFLDYVQKAEAEGGYIRLTIYDNPMVSAATIQRLMHESGGEHSSTWKREYLCSHVLDQNLAIINEWEDAFVEEAPKDQYYGFYQKYVAMDLGVKDHTAVLFGYYEFLKGRLVIEEEYLVNGPQMTTEVLKSKIQEKEALLWGEDHRPYLRVSDNNNPLLLQDLSYLHQLHFTATDKGRLDEMVNTLRMLVKSQGLIIHPRCKQLIGCMKYGVWDKNRNQFARSLIYGHFDALAALIYLVRNLNKSHNPIPHDFQVDNSNQILFTQKDSKNINSLKNAFGLTR